MSCAGLIPADGDVWKARRRAIVPSLHRKYIENMVRMFGDSALHGVSSLQQAHQVLPAKLGHGGRGASISAEMHLRDAVAQTFADTT